MSKNKYRSQNVKSVNREQLSELVRDKDIIFGHDVAKESLYGVFMDKAHDQPLKIISWKHPHQTPLVLDLLTTLPVSSLSVAMESSGTYGDSFRYQLGLHGIEVYRVSSKQSADSHELYDGVPSSHDAKSSAVIAQLHLWGKSSRWVERSDENKALRAAIRVMDLHNETYYRYCNKLEGLLARHWPELLALLDLTSASLLSLIGVFGSAEVVATRSTEARAHLRKIGGHFLKEEKIDAIIRSAGPTLGVPPLEEERVMLMEVAQETSRAYKKARRAKQHVEELTADDDSVENMAPVVGRVTAAVLKATIGDPDDYPSAQAYQKGMGLNLKERSSGKHKGKLKITKRGPGICRRYLYLAVLRLIQKDIIVWTWYTAKVKRDGGLKMKALVAVMRKLARALWHVGQGSSFHSSLLFNPSKLFLSKQK